MLSSDRTFDFNLLRWQGLAPYRGTDVAEMLDVAARVVPGDFESWHREFFALAERVRQEGWAAGFAASPVTQRDRAFRAASYYRAADFFLHGTPSDPRIMRTWALATEQFDWAISLMDPAGERVAIPADGFTVPAILFRARRDGRPRPTVLMFNGFDGSQEEMLHMCGIAALERGFNVLTFEGPGQPTVVREQHLGFRHDWERVVTPVVDHCIAVPEIDASRLGLIGVSFGGYVAPRAAAFEPRIGAVVTIDGLFDAHQSVLNLLTPDLEAMLDKEDSDGFNAAIHAAMDHNGLRWYIQHGLWCFRVPTPYAFFLAARPYTLEGVAQQIACPVLVCAAADDHLNPGQAENLAAALGTRATLRTFTAEESAGSHSHPGASMLLNGIVFDWLTATLNAQQPAASHQGHGTARSTEPEGHRTSADHISTDRGAAGRAALRDGHAGVEPLAKGMLTGGSVGAKRPTCAVPPTPWSPSSSPTSPDVYALLSSFTAGMQRGLDDARDRRRQRPDRPS